MPGREPRGAILYEYGPRGRALSLDDFQTPLLGRHLIVIIILIRRHRLRSALFPDTRFRRQLAQHPSHLPHMLGNRPATRANVVDTDLSSLERIVAHLLPCKLQRIEPVSKLRQAREI